MPQTNYVIRVRHPTTYETMAIVDYYVQAEYQRLWQDVGTFRIAIPDAFQHIRRCLLPNAIYEFYRDGRIDFTGIALKHSTEQRGDHIADDTWLIDGFDISDIARHYVALPAPLTTNDQSTTAGADFDTQTDQSSATALRYYVNRNAIIPNETARIAPDLSLGSVFVTLPSSQLGEWVPQTAISPTDPSLTNVTYKNRYQSFLDTLKEIARASNVGWNFRLDPDNQTIYYDVVVPANRSMSQSRYLPIMFDLSRESVLSFAYSNDGTQVVNTVYAGGSGTGSTRTVVVKKESASPQFYLDLNVPDDAYVVPDSLMTWGRREAFIDSRDGTTQAELNALVTEYLNTHRDAQSISFQPTDVAVPKYRIDYDIGDTITARRVFGSGIQIQGDAQIIGARITISPDGPPRLMLDLGTPIRSPATIIREFDRRDIKGRTV